MAGTTLRLMTYNIQGGAASKRPGHLEEIAAVISSAGVDLVALQEVHRNTAGSRGIDQLEMLAGHTGMIPCFGKSRSHGGGGSYGNAVLTNVPLIEATTRMLPGSGEPRSLLETRLEVGTCQVHVFVTHLTAWGPFGRRNRMNQTVAVAAILEQSTIPFVLAGDFNSTPTSRELQNFHSGTFVSSCMPSGAVTFPVTRQCLDYVFVDKRCTFRNARVLRTGPSDHWPLLVDIVLPETASPD